MDKKEKNLYVIMNTCEGVMKTAVKVASVSFFVGLGAALIIDNDKRKKQ